MKTTFEQDNQTIELIDAFRKGDSHAFSIIYDKFAPMMLNYGCCITTDKELVKDCIHDVFVKMYTKRNDGSIRSLSSYLIISLRNKLLDEFRRNTFMSDTDVDDINIKRVTMDVEHDYIENEADERKQNLVSGLLDTLTPRQREAFTLYYIEERKYEEICEIMDMNYHSIRNLVHRGMLKLRAAAV
jgi:RNA polymerase sigma factor (sigma-70 family)